MKNFFKALLVSILYTGIIFIIVCILTSCQQPIEREIPLSETLSQLGQCPPMCPYTISCWIPNITNLENKR